MQIEVQNGSLKVHGAINVRSVNRATLEQFVRQIRQPEIHTVDLSGVEHADSACLSLILAALREKGSLKFHALPDSVRALAELYEVEEWLNQ
ncbi:STAS domain-containing protein [Wielerella bovis]|uniref:STAS domain-containing protein n=1 Tax=Wielerella bovis TaxID=2917790 RepID=UPI002019F8DC|nr:STAS domain-containing protein [Wielerella bovis]MCG7656411.1 STAS domain-containing protein [Wielerella bovis]MCG7658636.1 STAS domain-containing protein [Wielerella bovis]ULJ60743.1 STAS domain-containing protein [Wielerella bovis]ULJ65164.1 STAS domain-containing protein [Wielerella bovis]ULJ67438.1 STAS domain-containing protein [Wielerella bovis]